MAKLGEGDPRWLVQDLGEAGRNVNAWHWTETDAMPWAKERLQELLGGMTLLDSSGPKAKIVKLKSCTGDCIINNRKHKVIPAYELEVRFTWEGTDADGNAVKGELVLPYISEENHDEDPEVQVTTTTSTPAVEHMRQAIYSQARPTIIEAIHKFVKELRAGGPQLAKAPKTGTAAGEVAAVPAIAAGAAAAAASAPAPEAAKKEERMQPAKDKNGELLHSVSLSARFFASPRDIYECFTDARRIMAYTRAPAEADPRPAGKLRLYDGSIEAEYRELEPEKRLVLDWRVKEWEQGVVSKVTLSIKEKDKGNTVLQLEQTGIPDHDKFGHHDCAGRAREGWERLFRQIKVVFGYGV